MTHSSMPAGFVRLITAFAEGPAPESPDALAAQAAVVYTEATVAAASLPGTAAHDQAIAATAQYGFDAGYAAAASACAARFVAGFNRSGTVISHDTTGEVLARHVAGAYSLYRQWRQAAADGTTDELAFPVGLLADYLALMSGTSQALQLTPSVTMSELAERENAAQATTEAGNPVRMHLFAYGDLNAFSYTDDDAAAAHDALGHDSCGLDWNERQIIEMTEGAPADIKQALSSQIAAHSPGKNRALVPTHG